MLTPARPLLAALIALAACAGAPPAPPPAPAAERLISTTRGRILADDGGRGGVPVLLVHGLGVDHTAWRDVLQHLRKDRRAVAVDLPGFGRSDPPRGSDASALALGEDLGRVADALGMSRFVLVVHGFAGPIGLEYAARHPLRVAGLLFVDAAGGRPDPGGALAAEERRALAPDRFRAAVEDRIHPMIAAALPETAERVQATLDKTSREAFLEAALAVLGVDPAATLAKYPGPRFALASAPRVLEGIQASVANVPFEKLEGTSHWIMLDRPDAVNAALDALLAKVK
jgi:pimeloyl-ACP methyl ester carboxylesterase